MISDAKHLFMYSFASLYHWSQVCALSILYILILVIYIIIEFGESALHTLDMCFIRYMICKYFLPVSGFYENIKITNKC